MAFSQDDFLNAWARSISGAPGALVKYFGASIYLKVRWFSIRPCKDAKPWDFTYELSNQFEIWQMTWQQCCRGTLQMSVIWSFELISWCCIYASVKWVIIGSGNALSLIVHTVETLYSTIYHSKYFIELNIDKFTQYVALWTHKRHPIPRPFERAMERLLWVLQQKLIVL